jgi:hypothetical protein
VRASLVSETERDEGCELGLDFGPRRRRKEVCCALGQRKDGPHGQIREERISIFSLYFLNFQMDFQKGFEFLFTCNTNQSITNKICSSMSASTCL